ncbi:RNA polymerase-binding protein RbpA [Allokutzneria albata]|uniref:RNA polymerase-binding protein RbpA n=1 Tax=Allokutzneria albata TaxID=211114 RepID=A0A1G9UHF0_ALLAB|nr:RNA polymerase-binding protein RbpA [Allokutzneria albata]SDM59352.1 RNA polymerase-binding protein [Allokutzneria albata]
MRARLRGCQVGGSVSYEPDRDHDLVKRQIARYLCPGRWNAKGTHEFEVLFAAEGTVVPGEWQCRQHGVEGTLIDPARPGPVKRKPERTHTHWDMLCERRSAARLEELVEERLLLLRNGTAEELPPTRRAPLQHRRGGR